MKKLTLLTAVLAASLPALANQLTPDEALARVKQAGSPRHLKMLPGAASNPILTIKPESNPDFNGVYVFNTENGYLIVSADDCYTPLLGYSESGTIDNDNLPPQLQYLLDFYAEAISAKAKNETEQNVIRPSARPAKIHPAVEPFIKTKWNQDDPYNQLCPQLNGERSVTGCVATAMAQAMKYYEWPKQGNGSHSYSWNGKNLSVNFANTTYYWDEMLPVYDSSASLRQNLAVAVLMYHCGVSVDMNYSPNWSGASSLLIAPALYDYFGYDKSMATLNRFAYTDEEWDAKVYNEVASGRPVLYCGDSKAGAHQFIADGYNDGYYHFNWGWGGSSDGYFLLGALDPYSQGIGGSLDDSGFNFTQQIVVNMMPAKEKSEAIPAICLYGETYLLDDKNQYLPEGGAVTPGEKLTIVASTGIFNLSCASLTGVLGVKITSENGQVTYCEDIDGIETLDPLDGGGMFSFMLPGNLADGKHYLSLAYATTDGDWTDIDVPLNGISQYLLLVENGEGKIYPHMPGDIVVSDFEITSPTYIGKDFTYKVTVTNPGDKAVYSEFNVDLYNESERFVIYKCSSAWPNVISLAPGETKTFEFLSSYNEVNAEWNYRENVFEYKTLDPGTYTLVLSDNASGRTFYVESNGITLENPPANTSIKTRVEPADGSEYVDPMNAEFKVTVECTEGFYTGKLYVVIYGNAENRRDVLNYTQTPSLLVPGGGSKEIIVKLNFDPLDYQNAIVTVSDEIDGVITPISDLTYFKIDSSGVEEIAGEQGMELRFTESGVSINSEFGIENVEIYDITGRKIAAASGKGMSSVSIPVSLKSGQYIIVVMDNLGRRIVRKSVR